VAADDRGVDGDGEEEDNDEECEEQEENDNFQMESIQAVNEDGLDDARKSRAKELVHNALGIGSKPRKTKLKSVSYPILFRA